SDGGRVRCNAAGGPVRKEFGVSAASCQGPIRVQPAENSRPTNGCNREGFRMPAWCERSTRRGPASESLRRRNPREAGGQLAGYGDLARQRRCGGMVCLRIAEG